MDVPTYSSLGALGIAALAFWRSSRRESTTDADDRTREIIRLTIGEDLAILKANVKRIMRKLDINGDD